MSKHFYSADIIFTSTEWLNDIILEVENNTITAMLPAHQVKASDVRHLQGMIVPAFIDIQLYGAAGRLFSVYPDTLTLKAMAAHCREGGTVLCLPTVATNTLEVSYRCIDAVQQYWAAGGTGIWGLHLEGPWIHPLKKGAHIESLIHPPSIAEAKSLLEYGSGVIKMITLAPEVCSDEVIGLIREAGITISAGHSNASFAEATAAFNKGIAAVTHLYNAMSPLQHREPGMVGAAFLHPRVRASIIPDGYHVDFAAVRIAKQVMVSGFLPLQMQ
jgi:N-acetylglucosamine-6-phosphate deacetylase